MSLGQSQSIHTSNTKQNTYALKELIGTGDFDNVYTTICLLLMDSPGEELKKENLIQLFEYILSITPNIQDTICIRIMDIISESKANFHKDTMDFRRCIESVLLYLRSARESTFPKKLIRDIWNDTFSLYMESFGRKIIGSNVKNTPHPDYLDMKTREPVDTIEKAHLLMAKILEEEKELIEAIEKKEIRQHYLEFADLFNIVEGCMVFALTEEGKKHIQPHFILNIYYKLVGLFEQSGLDMEILSQAIEEKKAKRGSITGDDIWIYRKGKNLQKKFAFSSIFSIIRTLAQK